MSNLNIIIILKRKFLFFNNFKDKNFKLNNKFNIQVSFITNYLQVKVIILLKTAYVYIKQEL